MDSIRTVTVWQQPALFPQASTACQQRVTVKPVPGWALVVVLTTLSVGLPQLSVAAGVEKLHGTPHRTVRSGPHPRPGGVVSITVTVWVQVETLPH
jgi:hypothetical protein